MKVPSLRLPWGSLRNFALAPCVLACVIWVSSPLRAEPQNLGDLKSELIAYQRSQDYDRELASVDAQAEAYLDAHVGGTRKPAIVLDIDETSLSNWPQLVANDFGYIPEGACARLPSGPCGTISWDAMAKASAIAPTLALFNDAKAKGVAVFFITGRYEAERAATEANLRMAGYRGWTAIIMRRKSTETTSVAEFKAPERGKLRAQGYDILLNIGDQPSDLSGGFADRSFKLPNPFYRIP